MLIGACSSAEKGPTEGSEKGACYGNHTCDDGLSCYSQLCVKAPTVLSNQSDDRQLQELRGKLEDARLTIARLEAARLQGEAASETRANDHGLAVPTVRDPFKATATKATATKATATKATATNSKHTDRLKNPFGDTDNRNETPQDPCTLNPSSPECMLD